MKKVLIANTKGGCGKSTLATNLAGYFAATGAKVALADLDKQQSSTTWASRRPENVAPIYTQDLHGKSYLDVADWLVTDSPGGFRDDKLSDAVKAADFVIVPIQPSAFDIGATKDFLEILAEEKAIRKEKTFVALVGMRVNYRTNSALNLVDFMDKTGFPVLTYLRSAQVYVSAAELGLSIFDMRPSQVTQDLEQWAPITEWLINSP